MRRAILIVALAVPATASAHFKLVAPEGMYSQSGLGDPQKEGPCGPTGDGGATTNQVTTVMAGSTLTLTINETIYHPGHYRVAIAQNPAGLPAVPTVTPGTTACGSAPIEANPTLPLLADGVLKHTSAFSGQQTAQIALPADMACTNCVVQVVEFMSNHPAPCFYYHCAVVNVTAGPGGTPDAGMTPGDDHGGGCSTGGGVGLGAAVALLFLAQRRRS